jgi:hypothetical protein
MPDPTTAPMLPISMAVMNTPIATPTKFLFFLAPWQSGEFQLWHEWNPNSQHKLRNNTKLAMRLQSLVTWQKTLTT